MEYLFVIIICPFIWYNNVAMIGGLLSLLSSPFFFSQQRYQELLTVMSSKESKPDFTIITVDFYSWLLFAVEGGLAHSNMNFFFLQEPKVTIKFYDDEFVSDMEERAVVESSLAKLLYTSISKERPFVVSPMANSSEDSKEGQKKYKKCK